MRYWGLTILGLGVLGASIVAIDLGVYSLVRSGTCAAGGPGSVARPCAPGTGDHIGALTMGIFGGVVGLGLYMARGSSDRPSPIPAALVAWALLFLTMAGSALLAGFGPAGEGDLGAKIAGSIIAVVFVPLGLVPLALGAATRRTGTVTGTTVPGGAMPPPPPPPPLPYSSRGRGDGPG